MAAGRSKQGVFHSLEAIPGACYRGWRRVGLEKACNLLTVSSGENSRYLLSQSALYPRN